MIDNRIIIKDKVYLLASDAGRAFGYDSDSGFTDDNKELIKYIPGLPPLISEEDFNHLLTYGSYERPAFLNIEMTKVITLQAEAETERAIYPLKLMVAEDYYMTKALKTGCRSIQEYIERYDYPEIVENIIERLSSDESVLTRYNDAKQYFTASKFFEPSHLKKLGLKIQYYTELRKGSADLNAFLVGKGIIHELYADDESYYEEIRVESEELIIPEYDMTTGTMVDVNYGTDPSGRDYREYTALENLDYVLHNKDINDAGVDLLDCHASGVNLNFSGETAFKLLNPNMFKDLLLLDGIVELSQNTVKTDIIICENVRTESQ